MTVTSFVCYEGFWDAVSRHLGADKHDWHEEIPEDSFSNRCCIREQLLAEVWGYADPC